MKKFLRKTAVFFLLFAGLILLLTFRLPGNPDSYNQAYRFKQLLLETTPSPRLILAGGSNVAFGFDSKMLEDSLGLPVINNGLHAGIGLKFMLDDISLYARAQDILILCPEYNQFFGELAYGALPLTEIISSIAPEKIVKLNPQQYFALLSNLPGNLKARLHYRLSKVLHKPESSSEILYSIHSFNSHGDMCRHWNLPPVPYTQLGPVKENFNKNIADYFIHTIKNLQAKQCRVFFCPAAISRTSYENMEKNIEEVVRFCKKQDIPFLGSIRHYVVPDSLCFDTPYHLSGTGTKLRTESLIKDLKKYLN